MRLPRWLRTPLLRRSQRYLVALHALRDDALADDDHVARTLDEFLRLASAMGVVILAYGVSPGCMKALVQVEDARVMRRWLRVGMLRSGRVYERHAGGRALWSGVGEELQLTSACDTYLAARHTCRWAAARRVAPQAWARPCVGSAVWTLEELLGGVPAGAGRVAWRAALDE